MYTVRNDNEFQDWRESLGFEWRVASRGYMIRQYHIESDTFQYRNYPDAAALRRYTMIDPDGPSGQPPPSARAASPEDRDLRKWAFALVAYGGYSDASNMTCEAQTIVDWVLS